LAEVDDRWDKLVDNRQVEKANSHPSVLASRLAIWVWQQARFKVYLNAPLDVRAGRVQKREGGNLAEIREATRARDAADHARYLRLYGIDNDQFTFADLVIDVSALGPEAIVDQILTAYRRLA
jgi:cytidylate kinase